MEPAISVVKRVVERAKPKTASKSGLHYAEVKIPPGAGRTSHDRRQNPH